MDQKALAVSTFEIIFTTIDQAIENEVGEVREHNPETQAMLSELQELLISVLDLPEDHKL